MFQIFPFLTCLCFIEFLHTIDRRSKCKILTAFSFLFTCRQHSLRDAVKIDPSASALFLYVFRVYLRFFWFAFLNLVSFIIMYFSYYHFGDVSAFLQRKENFYFFDMKIKGISFTNPRTYYKPSIKINIMWKSPYILKWPKLKFCFS